MSRGPRAVPLELTEAERAELRRLLRGAGGERAVLAPIFPLRLLQRGAGIAAGVERREQVVGRAGEVGGLDFQQSLTDADRTSSPKRASTRTTRPLYGEKTGVERSSL